MFIRSPEYFLTMKTKSRENYDEMFGFKSQNIYKLIIEIQAQPYVDQSQQNFHQPSNL